MVISTFFSETSEGIQDSRKGWGGTFCEEG